MPAPKVRVGETLDLKEQPGQFALETSKSELRDKQLLLLLDSFEHVEQAAPVVGDLVAAPPHVKVVMMRRVAFISPLSVSIRWRHLRKNSG